LSALSFICNERFSLGQDRDPHQDAYLLQTGASTVVAALPVLNASVNFLSLKLQLCATDNKTFFQNNYIPLVCSANKWKKKRNKKREKTHLSTADGVNACLLICLQND